MLFQHFKIHCLLFLIKNYVFCGASQLLGAPREHDVGEAEGMGSLIISWTWRLLLQGPHNKRPVLQQGRSPVKPENELCALDNAKEELRASLQHSGVAIIKKWCKFFLPGGSTREHACILLYLSVAMPHCMGWFALLYSNVKGWTYPHWRACFFQGGGDGVKFTFLWVQSETLFDCPGVFARVDCISSLLFYFFFFFAFQST